MSESNGHAPTVQREAEITIKVRYPINLASYPDYIMNARQAVKFDEAEIRSNPNTIFELGDIDSISVKVAREV